MISIRQEVYRRRRGPLRRRGSSRIKIDLKGIVLSLIRKFHGLIVFSVTLLLVGLFIYKNSGIVNRILSLDIDKGINILTLCVDKIGEGGEIDTLFLLTVSPKTNQLHILSIPKETVYYKSSTHPTKISHIYSKGGLSLLLRSIEEMLDTEIPFYVLLDYPGVVKVVDVLGGVRVDVKRGIRHIDRIKDVYINIPEGYQYLCGEKVLQYIAFIKKEGVDRIIRQEEIINALVRKALREGVFKEKRLIRVIKEYIKTNLSLRDTVDLLNLGEKIKGRVSISIAKGESIYLNGRDYWKIHLVKTKRLLRELDNNVEL